MYLNQIENRITFINKTGINKTGCYLDVLTPETMKSLRRNESNITKSKNGEDVPHLEITEVILVYCNNVSNDYQKI